MRLGSGKPTEFLRLVKRQAARGNFPRTRTCPAFATFGPWFGHGIGQNLEEADLLAQFVMEILEIGKFFPLG
jgi:hypothetical protein